MPISCFIHSHLDNILAHDDDDDFCSLTKQLADTAVTVREMSKQLGRTRIPSSIQTVLIVTKARDNRLIALTRELALYLMLKPRNESKRGLIVYVDSQLRHSRRFDAAGIHRDHPQLFLPISHRRKSSSSLNLSPRCASDLPPVADQEGQLRYWTSDMCSHSPHLFDFVVTLGGDGTVLFTSWLFQRIVPPVLPFALGSLGFLTNFDFCDYQSVMDAAIETGIIVNLRMRFTCTVYRSVANEAAKKRRAVKKADTGEILMKNVEKDGWEALEGGWATAHMPAGKDKEVKCCSTQPVETFEVLNDLVVDRGPSPYVSLLELFGDEHHMTTVQADGLTVATPTGSTAYSLSAGGSLVHPEIPAILITPICPHTLSFRPMLLPDTMELRICVPYNSRSTAWVSFDGRGRVELKQGDHIKVTASRYPFPTVCADKQSTDWFHAISRTLKWNERERQKSFVVVEEGPAPKKRRSATAATPDKHKASPDGADGLLDEEDEVTDDEEIAFDIDDSVSEAQTTTVIGIQTSDDAALGHEKAIEQLALNRLEKRNGSLFPRRASRSRSRSRPRAPPPRPRRYAGPHHYPPPVHHVNFDLPNSPDSSYESFNRGGRQTVKLADRDADVDNIQTPTVPNQTFNNRPPSQPRARSSDHNGHRAFAVWGQDESDSATSDGSDT
ncbi:ATP-NAD kinase [Amanita muscaria]